MRKLFPCLLLLLTGCTGQVQKPSYDESVLLIQVETMQVNNKNEPMKMSALLNKFKLKNLDTGKIYTVSDLREGYPAVVKVAPGNYCLYSFNTYVNMELEYCGDPFFKVENGQVNNAGKWQFGVSYQTQTHSLIYSMKEMDEVMGRARKLNPGLFDGRH